MIRKIKSRWLIGLLFLVLCGAWVLCIQGEYADVHPTPSLSLTDSKAKGRFQSSVKCFPSTIHIGTCEVELKEMWIERAMKRERSVLGFLRDQPAGYYFLCFTIKKGQTCFEPQDNGGPFFVLDNSGESFASINGSEVFWTRLSAVSDAEAKMYLLSSWKSPRTEYIEIHPVQE